MIKGIHHINFVVRDLAQAAIQFGQLLGVSAGPVEHLPQRGVKLVRFPLAGVWLILVHPLDPDSVPGKYLAEHGEGFFLMSLEVDDIHADAQELHAKGIKVLQDEARRGLDDWQLMDLNPRDLCGINIQLVETSAK